MANNPKHLLTLIDDCSENELTTNLNMLRSDLKCTDDRVSWLPLLKNYLEDSGHTTLNLYERMKMLVELRKIVPKILILTGHLNNSIKSTENVCPNYKFNFEVDLTENLVNHRSFCTSCFPSAVRDKATCDNVTPSTSIAEITSSDVNSQILRYYPTRIVDYALSIDRCSVSTVRLHHDGLIECILCKFKCSERKNKDKMDIHLSSRKHMKKLSSEHNYLVKFHEFWQGQSLDIWKKHLQFNYDFNRLKCVSCGKSVEYRHVADHLGTCLRPFQPEKRHFETTEDLVESPCEDIMSIKLGDNSFPILLCKENRVVCLICNETLTEDQQDQQKHLDSKNHNELLREKPVQASLSLYHKVWNQLPKSLQVWRFHFKRGEMRMTCTLCKRKVEYNMELLLGHLSGIKHLDCVHGDLGYECANIAKEVLMKHAQSNNVQPRVLYKGMPVLKLGNDILPTVQRLPRRFAMSYKCLICNKITGNKLTVHTTSAQHMIKEHDRTVQRSLALYHRVFHALPEKMQLRQTHFERGPEKLKCRLCKLSVRYDPKYVREHLEALAHPDMTNLRNKHKKAKQKAVGRTTDTKKREHAPTPEENHQKTADYSDTESPNNSDFYETEQEPTVKKIRIEEQPMAQMAPPGNLYFSYNQMDQTDFVPLSEKTEPDD